MAPKPTYEDLAKENLRLKQTVDELQADQEKFRAIYDHQFNCLFIHDLEGNFLDANDAALRMLGYERENISTLNFTSIFGEGYLAKAYEFLDQIKRKIYAPRIAEYKLKRKDGSIILKLDPRGNIKFMNEFAQEFFGYREKEILGRNVVRTIVPQKESSGRDLAAMIKDIGTHPERYLNNENENQRRNGERVWIAWTNRGIHDEKSDVTEVLCVGNDVTKPKRAEAALRESENKFRALAESAPAATLIVAGDKILYANQAFKQITGFTDEETLAMQFWDVVHPDMQKFVKKRGAARQRGETVPSRYELKALTKNGQTKWVDLVATVITYGGNTATLAVVYDITDRKQAEEALLAREQELENKTQDLEDMNAALKVLLQKREDDKVILEEKMLSNIKQLIEPYIRNLENTQLSARQVNLLNIIKSNLAEIMGLSVKTIEFHRTQIRSKFGLKNTKDNLQAHLITLDGR